MSKRYQTTDGIVIRRKALPSGDVIATLFSEHGKWRGVARKGKLPGGNLGRLSLFHDVSVQFYRKKDEDLVLITQVQLNGALPGLSDPEVYPYAHVLAELVDKLTVDVHVGEDLYQYFASGLRGLAKHPDPERVALVYAWRFIAQAGLAPQVTRCATCGKAQTGDYFDIAAGGLSCDDCSMGMRLSETLADDLVALQTATVREVLTRPLADRADHWAVLSRYLAFHVGDLRSLAGRYALRERAQKEDVHA